MADEDVVTSNDEVLAIYYTSSCICLGCRWSNLIGVGGSVPDAVIPLYYRPKSDGTRCSECTIGVLDADMWSHVHICSCAGARQTQMEACL